MGDPIQFAKNNIQSFFSQQSERFRFEGIIAHGHYGVTLKVTELGQTGPLAYAIPPEGIKRKRRRTLTPTELARAFKRIRISSAGTAIKVAVRNISPWGTPGRSASGNSSGRGSVERSQEIYPRRTLAIKRSLGERGSEELRDEIKRFRSVNGSIHIARLIAYRDDPLAVARRLAKKHPFPRGPLGKGDFLAGLTGPVLVMEYLENGVLLRMKNRLKERGIPIPNRIVWSMYLCAVRAVVALAYPQGYEPDSPPKLEQIPGPDVAPSRLVHGDIHPKNIMFGTTEPSILEHRHFPIMKLIDLGLATEEYDAVEENLFYVFEVIYDLLVPAPTGGRRNELPGRYKNIRTGALNLSDEARRPVKDVDPDLRDLVCRSMAVNVRDRPSLRDMLRITSQAVSTKTGESYLLFETGELDRDLQDFIQEMIYDTTSKPPPPLTPPLSSPPLYEAVSHIPPREVITISDDS